MAILYKILTRQDWEAFRTARSFHGSAHDIRDGFIHFSAAHQLAGTAEKHFVGQTDLVLLQVDSDRLAPEQLRWEPSRGGDLFPHLYGPLRLDDVLASEDFEAPK